MNAQALVLGYDLVRDREAYAEVLRAAMPGVTVTVVGTEAEALLAAPASTMLAAMAHHVTQAIVDAAPGLRMIQALTTGTDHLDTLRLPPDVTIASARGIHGPQMAELAFLFMLALARRFPDMLRNQADATWERWPQPVLRGCTVVVFGVGTIAEDLALRCQAFGVRTVGVSGARSSAPHFDAVHPRSDLAAVAAQADFLIVLAPYTEQNHHAIDAQVLAACKPGAFVINIARGGVVDEAALIDALEGGRIAGAALDVFGTEPLPADSRLWRQKRVIVTPHIGGASSSYAEDLVDLVTHNLRSFASGDYATIRNLVRGPR